MLTFLVTIVISGILCALLIGTQHRHLHISGRRDRDATHEIHQGEVPRLGGLAIFIAGLVGLTVLSNLMDDGSGRLLWSLWACLSLITIIGLYEDLKRNLPPLLRYIGTSIAVLMFSMANGGLGISSVALPWLDTLLSFKVGGVLFFTFAVTGATHAFNLIDGQHGLSAGVSTLCYLALSSVAFDTGQSSTGALALALAGANGGFLLFNYPHGRIFLGDCGAYFNGAAIGSLAVLVVEGSATLVSPWFALTLLVYPAWETIYSMIRRSRDHQSPFLPDVRHLHHLYFQKDQSRHGFLRYSSAPRLLLLAAIPIAISTQAYDNTRVLAASALLFVLLYSLIYSRLAASSSSKYATSSN